MKQTQEWSFATKPKGVHLLANAFGTLFKANRS